MLRFQHVGGNVPWRLEGSGTADSGNLGPRHSADRSGARFPSFIVLVTTCHIPFLAAVVAAAGRRGGRTILFSDVHCVLAESAFADQAGF